MHLYIFLHIKKGHIILNILLSAREIYLYKFAYEQERSS